MSDDVTDRALLSAVVQLFNALAMHAVENAAVQRAALQVADAVHAVGTAHVRLQVGDGAVFVDRKRVKLDEQTLKDAQSLQKQFSAFKAGQLTFDGHVTADELLRFVVTVQRWRRTPTPERALTELTGAVLFGAVTAEKVDGKVRLLKAYARLLAMVDTAATDKQPVLTPSMRRAVVNLLDASTDRSDELLALTQTHRDRAFIGHRAVAVASLTALLARRLGLSRHVTLDVAMTALVHDFHATDARDWRAQVVATAMRLLSPSLTPAAMRVVPAIVDARRTRFPPGVAAGTTGRLIAVPVAFDALVHPPLPLAGLAPDRALASLLSAEHARFDLRVVKAFAQVVGVYPVGTLVRLSSGAEGVVVGVAKGASPLRPTIRLLKEARGSQNIIDLAQPQHAGLSVAETFAARLRRVHAAGLVFG